MANTNCRYQTRQWHQTTHLGSSEFPSPWYYESRQVYTHMITSISHMKKLVRFAFVDNMDLVVHGPQVSSNNVHQMMQRFVNHWEGLLHATGGTLVPTKCFWYGIDFHWKNNTWQYLMKHDKPGEITIKDKTQWHVPIPWLETNEVWWTLDMQLAPDGNWEAEWNYLYSVANDWQVQMALQCLSPMDATFSLKNLILHKLQTYPWAPVHGPLYYGGLDIPQPYTEQLIAHVHTMLQYGPDQEDPTGHLLHVTGKAMHLEIGYSGKLLLAAPLCLHDNVTNLWLKWLSMQECGVTLLTDFADYPPLSHDNVELMQLFVQHGWKQPLLHAINQCRMYLQVFLLSDTVLGSGEQILPHFWEHRTPTESSLDWPCMSIQPQMLGHCGNRPSLAHYTWVITLG